SFLVRVGVGGGVVVSVRSVRSDQSPRFRFPRPSVPSGSDGVVGWLSCHSSSIVFHFLCGDLLGQSLGVVVHHLEGGGVHGLKGQQIAGHQLQLVAVPLQNRLTGLVGLVQQVLDLAVNEGSGL